MDNQKDLLGLHKDLSSPIKQSIIFKDKNILRVDAVPEQILHRGEQLEKLKQHVFGPGLWGYAGNHLLVTGGPGTGKTLCTLYMKEMSIQVCKEKKITDLRYIYVNCSRKSNATAVASAILREMNVSFKTDNVLDNYLTTLFKEIDDRYKYCVIILDEVDKILPKNPQQSDSLFYSLLRARELRELKNAFITLVLISNDPRANQRLSPGTQSSFGVNYSDYPRYKKDQIFEILKNRAVKAFNKPVFNDKILLEIAQYIEDTGGDCRKALSLLKISGEIAEEEQAERISLVHFNKSKKAYETNEIMQELNDMSWHEQMAIMVLVNSHLLGKEIRSIKHIYSSYKELCRKAKQEPVSDRQVRNYYKNFLEAMLVDEYQETGQLHYCLIIPDSAYFVAKHLEKIYQEKLERVKGITL